MDPAENDMTTRFGPGTPAGETLRACWLPVSFSDELKSVEPTRGEKTISLFTGLEEHKEKINQFRPWLESLVAKK